jgi:hypothetical protein
MFPATPATVPFDAADMFTAPLVSGVPANSMAVFAPSVAATAGAWATSLIQAAMQRVERVRVISDLGMRFDQCIREADEARRVYKVDEAAIVKVADTIRGGNRMRVNDEVIKVLSCDAAFYLQPAIQFGEMGALLQPRPYVRSARELQLAGRNPGQVAVRVLGRVK